MEASAAAREAARIGDGAYGRPADGILALGAVLTPRAVSERLPPDGWARVCCIVGVGPGSGGAGAPAQERRVGDGVVARLQRGSQRCRGAMEAVRARIHGYLPFLKRRAQVAALMELAQRLRVSDVSFAESVVRLDEIGGEALDRECRIRGLYVDSDGRSPRRPVPTPGLDDAGRQALMRIDFTDWVRRSAEGAHPLLLLIWALDLR